MRGCWVCWCHNSAGFVFCLACSPVPRSSSPLSSTHLPGASSVPCLDRSWRTTVKNWEGPATAQGVTVQKILAPSQVSIGKDTAGQEKYTYFAEIAELSTRTCDGQCSVLGHGCSSWSQGKKPNLYLSFFQQTELVLCCWVEGEPPPM